ncbi:MAG: DUF262 domain-containing protein [Chloroflexi bacterium]|nr:DUF262 domain-containing protein [Chloroflexota bacterium]
MSIQNGNDNDIEAIFRDHLKIEQYLGRIESLFNQRRRKRIKHDPDYQRNYVWDKQKQSYFIESILLGTEIPPLIFFRRGDDHVEVIDGRQRFETIDRFVNNEFDLSLNGLLTMTSLARKKYDDLTKPFINSFLDTNLRIFEFSIVGVNEVSGYREDLVKKEIFRRYNSGITPLRKSEFEKAQNINDPVTKYFGEQLERNLEAFSDVVRVFSSPGRQKRLAFFDPSLLDEIMVRVRKLLVLQEVPIRYYESRQGKQLAEYLYDRLSADTNPSEVYDAFMSRVSVLVSLWSEVSTKTPSRNRFLYEALYWSLAVLEMEGVDLSRIATSEFASSLGNYVERNSHVYDSASPHFRHVVIARFEKTAEFFEGLFDLELGNHYIKNNGRVSATRFRNNERPVEEFQHVSNLRLNKPDPQSTTVEDLHNQMMRKQFLVRPIYQRYERITNVKASAIIESMILGIKLPPIFVFERRDGVIEVIDGQQRILSILGFMNLKYMDEKGQQVPSTKEGFKLRKLRLLKELNGIAFTDLDEYLQNKLWLFTLYQVTIRESENPQFDPVDLFIRLNNKPYPIKDNTFEMWNSFVDRRVVNMIKEKTLKHSKWFYLRVDNKRMYNEDLYTTLAYFEYQRQSNNAIQDVLDFYAKGSKISSRTKSKTNITKLLDLVSKDSVKRDEFFEAIKLVEAFVRKTRSLLVDENVTGDREEWLDKELTGFFGSKPRSYNQFYVLWYVLRKINLSMIQAHKKVLKPRIHQLMMFVRATDAIDDTRAVSFFEELVNSIWNEYSPSERKLRLTRDEILDRITAQGNKCPLCGYALFHGEDVEVDHIVPISLGGPDSLDNVQIVHWICNREKGNALT